MRFLSHGHLGSCGILALITCCVLGVARAILPATAHAQKVWTLSFAGSHPRGDFATGWQSGRGLEGALQWPYWRSVDASVSLTVLDHAPLDDRDPQVLLGVWTLGVHWKPKLGWRLGLDLLFGAQSHTAVFHRGWERYEADKGSDESDLGFCLGLGLDGRLSGSWRVRLGVRTNTIFTQPAWVRYESFTAGAVYTPTP